MRPALRELDAAQSTDRRSVRTRSALRDAVRDRASEGLVPLASGAFFEYYLTFAISAEVGVLVRWLTSGMHESVEVMARIMTALMFVRPGDLYGRKIDFDIPAIGIGALATKGNPDD